jgi:AMP deaminase
MTALNEDKSAVQTPTSGSSSGGLDIPESMDGFFGYSEEKSLKQVFGIVITPTRALNCFTQIEEKYWAHRRGSDAHSETGSLRPLSLQGSSIGDAFHEEQEVIEQLQKLTGMVHVTGACNLRILIKLCSLFHRTCYRHRANSTSSITSTMP